MRWLLVVALVAAGCGGAPEDPLERLLAAAEEAVEDRDAEAFATHLAPTFMATGGMNRAATAAEVRRLVALYQGIDVTLSGVERIPPSTVRFRADFSGRPKDLPGLQGVLPAASAFLFEVQTAPGPDGELHLTSASWERVPMPGETAP